MSNDGLLEHLAEQRGCFLSSLRDPLALDQTLGGLLRTDPDRYSLDEWNECLSYLFQRQVRLRSTAEVCDCLKSAIRKQSAKQ